MLDTRWIAGGLSGTTPVMTLLIGAVVTVSRLVDGVSIMMRTPGG